MRRAILERHRIANVFARFQARGLLTSGCLMGVMTNRLIMIVRRVAVGNISMRVTVRISIVGAVLMEEKNVSLVRLEI